PGFVVVSIVRQRIENLKSTAPKLNRTLIIGAAGIVSDWLTTPQATASVPVPRYAMPLLCFAVPNAFLIDRKSTRLNSSHVSTSYAVFCLNKKSDRALVMLV